MEIQQDDTGNADPITDKIESPAVGFRPIVPLSAQFARYGAR